MAADRTYLRCLCSDHDMPTVAADPNGVALLGKYPPVLHILQQRQEPLLVRLFDLADLLEPARDVLEALRARFFRKGIMHIDPLEMLAVGGVLQVVCRFGHEERCG